MTIPQEEIDRFFDKEFSELMPEAQVPGFRPGRAPRKLVEAKFRKEVSGKVKNELLVASLGQISEDESLSAISEPDAAQHEFGQRPMKHWSSSLPLRQISRTAPPAP